MPSFFLAFVSVFVATLAGREALRIARLAAAGVSTAALLVATCVAALIFAGLAATMGHQLTPLLNPRGAQLIAAIALTLAACEVLFLPPGKAPAEPTLSVGALTLVLAGAQVTGAAGLLTIAITLARGEAILAGLGSASGAFLALVGPVLAGALWEKRWPVNAMRWLIGLLLFTGGLATGLPIFVPMA